MRISDWSSDVCSSDLEGSVRLTDGADAPAGQLNLRSDDVIVATLAAIGDVAAAGSTDAIESRLAQNDGIVSDDGALYARGIRSEEHTSELQSLMRLSYAVFCLKKKKTTIQSPHTLIMY